MKKRSTIAFTMIIMLALTMVASLVPGMLSHAEEGELESVELTLDVPKAGDIVTKHVEGETKFYYDYRPIAQVTSNTIGAEVLPSGRRWYTIPTITEPEEIGDGTIESPWDTVGRFSGAFEAGKDYYVLIDVELDEDIYSSFSEDVQVTINGATVINKKVWSPSETTPYTDLEIIAKVSIPADDSQSEAALNNDTSSNTEATNANTSSATNTSGKSKAAKTADTLPIGGFVLVFTGASIIGFILIRRKIYKA